MVNDCSTDDSLAVMRTLDVIVLDLPRRCGQNGAILRGLAAAMQPMTCVMDADLQDPPEAAPAMLDALIAERARVVFSSREAPRRFGSRLFRKLIRRLFPSLPAMPCLCFAMDAASREALVRVAVRGDYVVALIGALRLKTSSVPVRRAEPPDGVSAYSGPMRIGYAVRMLGAAVLLRAGFRIKVGAAALDANQRPAA